MATLAKLDVILGFKDDGFDSGMAGAKSRLDDLGRSMQAAGRWMTTRVTLPLVAAGGAAIKWASDLDESINKTNVLFGDSSLQIKVWSANAANAMGMSQQAALDYSSSYAGMLNTVAQGPGELADMSMAMTQLTSDFASFHNLNPADAFTVLSSALAGETEAIRRYGVDVSAAAVEQEALAMGLASSSAELTEQDKLLARYSLILKQTKEEQGDFARTSNSTSNQFKIMRARIQDVGASFGKFLLPYVNRALSAFIDLLNWLDDLDPKWQKVILAIAAFAAALGPVLIVLGMLLPGLGALATVIGFLLSPIGLLVIAIAALIGLGIYAWVNDLWGVRDAVDAVVDALQVFRPMLGDLYDAFQALREGNWAEVFYELRDAWDSFGRALMQLGGMVLGALADLGRALWDALMNVDWGNVLSTILSALGSLADALMGWVRDAADWVAGYDWGAMWGTVKDVTGDIISRLGDLALALALWVGKAIGGIDWGSLWGTVKDVTGDIISRLGDLALALALWVGKAIGGIDWGSLWGTVKDVTGDIISRLGDLALALALWVGKAIGGIDWGSLWGTVKDVTGDIISRLGDLALALALWVGKAIGGIDWGLLWGTVKDVTGDIVAKLGDLLAALTAWVSDAIRGVDWVALAGQMGTALADGIRTAVGFADDIKDRLIQEFDQARPSASDLASWASTLASTVKSAIVEGIRNMVGFAAGLKDRIVQEFGEMNISASDVASVGSAVAGAVWEAIKNAATNWDWMSLVPDQLERFIDWGAGQVKGKQAIDRSGGTQGVFDQVRTVAQQMASTVSQMATALAGSLKQVSTAFQTSGQQSATALQQLQQRAQQVYTQVAQTAGQQAQQMQQRVTQAFQQLVAQASGQLAQLQSRVASTMAAVVAQMASAMSQFASQVQSGFQRAVAAAQSGANQIRSVVAGLNLGSQGYSIGASLGQGIAAGIQAYIGSVAAAAAALVNAAVNSARAAAAARSPSRKMMALGGDMAEGLAIGLERGAASVSAATASLIGIPGASGGQTSGVVAIHNHNYYSVTPEDLRRLIEGAEAGGEFARSFGRELGLYAGTP